MRNTAQTLKTFFGGFDLPAYTLDSVPETVELPYVVYPLIEPHWREQSNFYCRVYYPKNRLGELLAKADQIKAAIGEKKSFDQPGWHLVLQPTNYDEVGTDDFSQYVHIGMVINAYHMPGQ